MKRTTLFLFLVLGASTLTLAGVKAPRTNTGTAISNNAFPKIYRPFFNIFRRIFPGKKSMVECYSADVTAISLSTVEVRKASTETLIDVSTTAIDRDGDRLTYRYIVTAGKIEGTGPKIIWDLSGIAPGTYFITAAVDDGCGFCGRSITRRVEVLACDTCGLRETD